MKYGDISLVLCISTRLRLMTILSLLVKYLVILHADPCNKSYNTDRPDYITLLAWVKILLVLNEHHFCYVEVSYLFKLQTSDNTFQMNIIDCFY